MPRDCVLKDMPVGCIKKGKSIVCDRPADFECDDKGYLQINTLAKKSEADIQRAEDQYLQSVTGIKKDLELILPFLKSVIAPPTKSVSGAAVSAEVKLLEEKKRVSDAERALSSINMILTRSPFRSAKGGSKTKRRKTKNGKTRRRRAR
jgi:hypothetical protein